MPRETPRLTAREDELPGPRISRERRSLLFSYRPSHGPHRRRRRRRGRRHPSAVSLVVV